MLKEARQKAGLSREEAAWRLHIGTRTLFEYEKGNVLVPPDVVLRMAAVYKQPMITAKYCEESCPIGQVYANPATARSLCQAVLGLLKEHAHVAQIRNRLIKRVKEKAAKAAL